MVKLLGLQLQTDERTRAWVKVPHYRSYLNLDAFAPAGEWDEFMAMPTPREEGCFRRQPH
jgi:hypothetical protein